MDQFLRQYGSWLIFAMLFGVMIWAQRRGYGCCGGGRRQPTATSKQDEQQSSNKSSGSCH